MNGTTLAGRDAILLEGIEVPCALGVTKAEREMRRPVRIDLELGVDLSPAARSDQIDDALDYVDVYARVAAIAGQGDHALVEALARRILDDLFDVFGALRWIRIEVRKARPVSGVLDWTGCRMTRQRDE